MFLASRRKKVTQCILYYTIYTHNKFTVKHAKTMFKCAMHIQEYEISDTFTNLQYEWHLINYVTRVFRLWRTVN